MSFLLLLSRLRSVNDAPQMLIYPEIIIYAQQVLGRFYF